MTPEERRYYIKNQARYIEMYIAQHDEEVKTRKLQEFLAGKELNDDAKHQLSDAVIAMHNAARLLEENIGKGTLSENIRYDADKLSDIVKRRYE